MTEKRLAERHQEASEILDILVARLSESECDRVTTFIRHLLDDTDGEMLERAVEVAYGTAQHERMKRNYERCFAVLGKVLKTCQERNLSSVISPHVSEWREMVEREARVPAPTEQHIRERVTREVADQSRCKRIGRFAHRMDFIGGSRRNT